MVKEAIWLTAASGVALWIALDMRRLRVNRVGVRLSLWVVACACTGPAAGLAYLVLRPAVRRTLVDAVWRAVGDTSIPLDVRRARLLELRRSGLVGEPVFRFCLRVLEDGNHFTNG